MCVCIHAHVCVCVLGGVCCVTDVFLMCSAHDKLGNTALVHGVTTALGPISALSTTHQGHLSG